MCVGAGAAGGGGTFFLQPLRCSSSSISRSRLSIKMREGSWALLRMRYWLISRSDMRLAASRCSGGQRLGSSRRETSSSPSAARRTRALLLKALQGHGKGLLPLHAVVQRIQIPGADSGCLLLFNVNELLERVLQLLQKIQIFRKIQPYVSPFPAAACGRRSDRGPRNRAVLDLLTERLYLVTGGAGPDLLRDLRGQLAHPPCMPAGCPENWI